MSFPNTGMKNRPEETGSARPYEKLDLRIRAFTK
jgi:hypothetical protein